MTTPSLLLSLSKPAQALADIALACQQSTSFYEDMSWYRTLHRELNELLSTSRQAVEEVLDFLHRKGELLAYERLLSMVETASIYTQVEHDGVVYDGLTLVMPVAAWSRFLVPQPKLRAEDVAHLDEALRRVVLTEGAKVYLHPHWMRSAKVDISFAQVHELTKQLVAAAIDPQAAEQVVVACNSIDDDALMNADAMVILVGVAVPVGQAMFRWQQGPAPLCLRREDILRTWQKQVSGVLSEQFPACNVEVLLPEAFYAAMSGTERQIQVGALSCHLARLQDRFPKMPLSQVAASVALCRFEQQYEVRIGLSHSAKAERPDEGMVWYLTSADQTVDYHLMDVAQSVQLTMVAEALDRLGVKQVNICRRIFEVYDWHDEEEGLSFPNAQGRLMPLAEQEEESAAPRRGGITFQ